MNLFKRGRKETSGSSSATRSSGSKTLSASLPSSSSASKHLSLKAHAGSPPLPEKSSASLRSGGHHASSPAMYISERRNDSSAAVTDEFGALLTSGSPVQGRSGVAARPALTKDATVSSTSENGYLKPLPLPGNRNITRRMSTGSAPSIDGLLKETLSDTELQARFKHCLRRSRQLTRAPISQLCYGYWPIETQRQLSLAEIEEVVRLCGQEIRLRGIEAPMLFSTQALDISLENITSLIRSYVSDRSAWKRDLRQANPHDLAGFIKWALGRYINPQGGRGFLSWEMYERWRSGEREKSFPRPYLTTNLTYQLPTQNAALLSTLLSLLCGALAYTYVLPNY